MISFDDAVGLLGSVAGPLGSERVPLCQAHRRVLAEVVTAQVCAPPADVSAMDGYAVREADLAALPATLRVVGESLPGSGFAGAVEAGTCVRIFTGAPVPPGADRVVIQEVVRREGEDAVFETAPGAARFVRRRASDFARGDMLLPAGTWLGARQLVAAAAADADGVTVWRRPRLIVLATGDELARPGTARERPGAIPDSIALGVGALAEEWGGIFAGSVILADRLEEMVAAGEAALGEADTVVVTGGASVGERDFAKRMFPGLELLFSKVSIKPGKPVWLGRAGGRVVLGLPGNPTSALVTARLFLAPLLAGMTGRPLEAALRWRTGALAEPAGPVGGRETFARGRMKGEAVRLASNQDSGAQSILVGHDLLVRLRPGERPLPAGTRVEMLDF